jgi:hypothetical protein
VEDANVGNEGVKGIAEALKANETLTCLRYVRMCAWRGSPAKEWKLD